MTQIDNQWPPIRFFFLISTRRRMKLNNKWLQSISYRSFTSNFLVSNFVKKEGKKRRWIEATNRTNEKTTFPPVTVVFFGNLSKCLTNTKLIEADLFNAELVLVLFSFCLSNVESRNKKQRQIRGFEYLLNELWSSCL